MVPDQLICVFGGSWVRDCINALPMSTPPRPPNWVGIVDGNHRSGIRIGGIGGVAVGGIGVCVVGGFIGGFSCPVPVVVCPCIAIGGSVGTVMVGGLRVGVLTCV